MNLQFCVQTRINKSLDEVFRTIVNEKEICKHFVDKTDRSLEEGKTVIWHWDNYGDYPIHVKEVIPDKKIVFAWRSHKEETDIQAIFDFESPNGTATLLKITESGWRSNQDGLDASYDNLPRVAAHGFMPQSLFRIRH